jgi:hypothetical protein
MEEGKTEAAAATNPLTRKLNKILNGGEGSKGLQGPSEVMEGVVVLDMPRKLSRLSVDCPFFSRATPSVCEPIFEGTWRKRFFLLTKSF